MRTLPFLVLLASCAVPGTTQRAGSDLYNAVVSVQSHCVDTLRTLERRENTSPPRFYYRDVAYMYQVRAEVDLRVTERYGDVSLALVTLTPDDSLSHFLFKWKDAIDISPSTATFSLLVRTTSRGTGFITTVNPREKKFTRADIRSAGFRVAF